MGIKRRFGVYLLDVGCLRRNSMKIAVSMGVCGNWYVCLCPDYWMFCSVCVMKCV